MTEPINSTEHLENLFREGKISQSDYEMLRQALETKAREEAAARQETAAREATAAHDVTGAAPRRLCKSWTNRQVGGVCGGIADYFGLNVWPVRDATMILGFLFCSAFLLVYLLLYDDLPWSVILAFLFCSTILVVYLVLYFVLPWDESPEEARIRANERWLIWLPFASALFILWIFNHAIFLFFVPRVVDVYAQLGAELPALSRLVVRMYSLTLQYGILAFPLQVIFLAMLVTLYAIIPHPITRRVYALIVCALFLVLTFVIAQSFFQLVFDMPKSIR